MVDIWPSRVTSLVLELKSIAKQGAINHGLKTHPARQHIIYPVGTMVVIEDIMTREQAFLSGHSNTVSCLDVSPDGALIASGQVTYMGFKAEIIVWDFETRQVFCKLVLHRNSVEAVAFTCNSKYLLSLGGQDDNSVVLWNVAAKEAICGSPAQLTSGGTTYCLACAKTVDNVFITSGRETLRIWTADIANRKLHPIDIRPHRTTRITRCLYIDDEDKYVYCGTTSGDIMIINMITHKLRGILPPEKRRFSCGVTVISQFKSGQFVIGTGDGLVVLCDPNLKKTGKEEKFPGAVTSIALRGDWHQFYVGTSICNIYRFNHVFDFRPQLMETHHHEAITDLVFPVNCSQILLTCSHEDICIWCIQNEKRQEVLRITVPNMTCNAVTLMADGKSIISGWSDCRIRAFYPESGRLMYMVNKAYGSMVTAIATYRSCRRIISGSDLGHVVVWDVPEPRETHDINHAYKHFVLKEHKAAVTCIKVRQDDSECVSSSIDGSCCIWDLKLRSRRQMLRLNTLFKYVCYHPLEHQVITTGTDRKIGFWETFDGTMLRELEGSLSGSVNALDVSADGNYFVSGGSDKIVKLWLYELGEVTHVGIGHSAPITGLRFSPNETYIVSVSSDGSIIIWKFPTPKPPTPDIMASVPVAAEAMASKNDDELDRYLVAGDPNYEFEPVSITKAGVIMPARDECKVETT